MAVLLAGGMAAYPIVRSSPSLLRATIPLAAVAFAFVVVAVVWRSQVVGPALFVLTAGYLVVEITGHAGALSVIAYAVGLVMLCELLMTYRALPMSGVVEYRVVAERVLSLVALGVGAAAVAVLVLFAGGWWSAGALEAGLIGMAAVVCLFALPWALVRHRR
ncbi:MAG: hypothetical protein GX630_10965 [Actinobacteria bacterium]|nr:hypothetical protein [Actinomycetota bacterium]